MQLYRIHSGIANDLHTLGQQVAQLAQSTLVQEANHGSAAGLLREFENYRHFVIMSTDVLAVDPARGQPFLGASTAPLQRLCPLRRPH